VFGRSSQNKPKQKVPKFYYGSKDEGRLQLCQDLKVYSTGQAMSGLCACCGVKKSDKLSIEIATVLLSECWTVFDRQSRMDKE
jgi:hypothetical protein